MNLCQSPVLASYKQGYSHGEHHPLKGSSFQLRLVVIEPLLKMLLVADSNVEGCPSLNITVTPSDRVHVIAHCMSKLSIAELYALLADLKRTRLLHRHLHKCTFDTGEQSRDGGAAL